VERSELTDMADIMVLPRSVIHVTIIIRFPF